MLLLAFSFWGFVKGFLMFVCILSALLLMLVVLLQEPKGGGLSSAFGGAGAETFGVQTGSVNKFTSWVAGIFMASALFYAAIRPEGARSVFDDQPAPASTAPADVPADASNAPADGSGSAAPTDGGEPAGDVEKD